MITFFEQQKKSFFLRYTLPGFLFLSLNAVHGWSDDLRTKGCQIKTNEYTQKCDPSPSDPSAMDHCLSLAKDMGQACGSKSKSKPPTH